MKRNTTSDLLSSPPKKRGKRPMEKNLCVGSACTHFQNIFFIFFRREFMGKCAICCCYFVDRFIPSLFLATVNLFYTFFRSFFPLPPFSLFPWLTSHQSFVEGKKRERKGIKKERRRRRKGELGSAAAHGRERREGNTSNAQQLPT